MGRGPLSPNPADGNYEIVGPKHRLFIEDSPKHVRVEFAGEVVVNSFRVKLLHETGLLPVYYFPRTDLRFDLLSRTNHSTTCPFKGRASYWTLRVGDRSSENLVWAYEEPNDPVRLLADYAALYLDRVDAVYEESDRILGHPRDPYHRVDLRASDRHVRVVIGGEVIAETRHPCAVFETALPARWYVPRDAIHMERLVASETTTVCPYKGNATYWSLRGGPRDIAWAYEKPLPGATGLAGHLCFAGERVVVEVDGKKT